MMKRSSSAFLADGTADAVMVGYSSGPTQVEKIA
jgi:hypothetical protein